MNHFKLCNCLMNHSPTLHQRFTHLDGTHDSSIDFLSLNDSGKQPSAQDTCQIHLREDSQKRSPKSLSFNMNLCLIVCGECGCPKQVPSSSTHLVPICYHQGLSSTRHDLRHVIDGQHPIVPGTRVLSIQSLCTGG